MAKNWWQRLLERIKPGAAEEQAPSDERPDPAADFQRLQDQLLPLRRRDEETSASVSLRWPLMEEADEAAEERRLRERLSHITVVSFVGSSGTGKSTQASRVARDYNIAYMIDDGILIHGSRIVAGTSAKRAETKIDSVRKAMFMDESSAATMRRALAAEQPTTLMILGTSDNMLQRICDNLWLPQPTMLIRIEDVTTEEERRIAHQTRLTEGQHTIPVPSMEIKHEFSGSFQEYIGRLRRRITPDRPPTYYTDADRTVVRPHFSTLGHYSISDEAMRHLTALVCRDLPGVAEMVRFSLNKDSFGVVINLEIAITYGHNAQEVMRTVQEAVARALERYTAINIQAVNVRASRVAAAVRSQAGVV